MTEAGWTREKPSKEGVYWFRWTVNSNSLIVSVAKDDCDWRVLEMGHQYDGALAGYGDGEWLGPITPDSYRQGRVAGLREGAEMVPGIMQHPHGSSKDWCEAQRAICAAIKRRAQQAQEGWGMYSRSMESKLIRTTHKITFDIGHSVVSFKEEFAKIPDHLRLTDIEEGETGQTILSFLHEVEAQ